MYRTINGIFAKAEVTVELSQGRQSLDQYCTLLYCMGPAEINMDWYVDKVLSVEITTVHGNQIITVYGDQILPYMVISKDYHSSC